MLSNWQHSSLYLLLLFFKMTIKDQVLMGGTLQNMSAIIAYEATKDDTSL